MNQLLFTAKFGMLVLGMFAVLCIPQIALALHGQSHSNHLHAYANAMGYLAEKENEEKKQITSVNKNADSKSHIVIASDERAELPCPQKTDDTDER